MQKITPYLWFDHQAEEAVKFYTSIFKNSKIEDVVRYGEEMSGQAGTVMNISFELEGQKYYALNGGPAFSFTPAISFFVECADQEEVDYYWDRLSEGGTVEIWCILADHPHSFDGADVGQRSHQSRQGHASHAADAEDRCRQIETGLRAGIIWIRKLKPSTNSYRQRCCQSFILSLR
jgi:predicted 3-demethylubiquinone-9 3-methyltransferase (glyoxalase superfamily)